MLNQTLLLAHIASAVVGLLSGFLAVMLRKGSGLHRAAGAVFVGSMFLMTTSAAYLAAFHKPNALNLVAALLACYLVATGWSVLKRRDGIVRKFEGAALAFILTVAAFAMTSGLEAAGSPRGVKDGMPAAIYFVFGSVALLCGTNDIRAIRRGGLTGTRRIVRHLWRLCLALLIATLSFYPGQARNLPDWFRGNAMLFAPHIFLIGAMLFWRYRFRSRTRGKETARAAAQPPTPTAAPAT